MYISYLFNGLAKTSKMFHLLLLVLSFCFSVTPPSVSNDSSSSIFNGSSPSALNVSASSILNGSSRRRLPCIEHSREGISCYDGGNIEGQLYIEPEKEPFHYESKNEYENKMKTLEITATFINSTTS